MNITWAVILFVLAFAESGFMLLNYQVNVRNKAKWLSGGNRVKGTHWSMGAWVVAHWAIRLVPIIALTTTDAGSLL